MKKRPFVTFFVPLFLFMAVCLVSLGTSVCAYAQEEEEATRDDGRRMSPESQEALVEANRRLETNPDDLAAARQPLIDFLASPMTALPDTDPVPLMLYQMLGQLWYMDENAENNISEANKIFKAGFEAFPLEAPLLLNYAVTTYEMEQYQNAAPLFEEYYELEEKHEIKYLEYAAAAYYAAENLSEAKRVFLRMMDLVELPETRWMDSIISICTEMDDPKETEKYTRLALDLYPAVKKYWNLMAQVFYEKEDLKAAAAVLEIATRVEAPERATEWKVLIDLYNYANVPLRIAARIQEGLQLLLKEENSSEKEQQILVAEAYARAMRIDEAVSYLDAAIAKDKSYDLLIKKATILYEARKNEEALAALDECIAFKKKAYDAYWMKGMVAWDQKDWETMKDAFKEAKNSKDENYRLMAEDALAIVASLDKAKSE